MRAGAVKAQEIIEEGYRLTGAFHITEDRLAVATLRKWRGKTSRVDDLVTGRRIFRGPIFSRVFVKDPSFGEPYVSAKDIVNAGVSPAGYLSRKHGSLLEDLRLHEGMILVTCSGMNLGKAIWAGPEFDGLVASHDLIRIEPNYAAAPPGYLYAFLASRYGHAVIRKQIYGGSIKHIEPEHIANLPVPRLGAAFETKVHELVERAAKLRSEAAQLLVAATAELETVANLPYLEVPPSPTPFDACAVPSSALQARIDGFFHSRFHSEALAALARSQTKALSELASRIVEPLRFKRVAVDDPAFGVPFFGTAPLFWADPTPNYFVSRKMRNIEQYLVDKKCLLIPRSGQLSGIIGSVVLPYGDIVGGAVSEDAIRVYFESEQDAGFGLVALTSEYGRRQLKARAFGSSIPHLDVKHIGLVRVPDPGPEKRKLIGTKGARVAELRDEACRLERQARVLLEAKIEKGAVN
jgi:type I restriction enzyme, S subunit